MKNSKIVLVSQWDGWCGACAAERPLVLTRTGRQRLRTWLTAAPDDSRPLVLTCRLCGTGVDVPLEQDDPPVVATWTEPEAPPEPVLEVPVLEVPVREVPEPAQPVVSMVEAVPEQVPAEPVDEAHLTAARQDVASALGALLAARTATAAPAVVAAPVAVAAPLVAPAVPLQRTAAGGGLAELQLLADGIDLLSSGRA